MRHIKIILTIFFSFSIYYTYATNDSICGTESLDSATFVNLPWIENNQFLLNLVDSVENSCSNCRTSPNGLSTKKYQVPIKAVVFYNDTYNGITDIQVQQYIKEAN